MGLERDLLSDRVEFSKKICTRNGNLVLEDIVALERFILSKGLSFVNVVWPSPEPLYGPQRVGHWLLGLPRSTLRLLPVGLFSCNKNCHLTFPVRDLLRS